MEKKYKQQRNHVHLSRDLYSDFIQPCKPSAIDLNSSSSASVYQSEIKLLQCFGEQGDSSTVVTSFAYSEDQANSSRGYCPHIDSIHSHKSLKLKALLFLLVISKRLGKREPRSRRFLVSYLYDSV